MTQPQSDLYNQQLYKSTIITKWDLLIQLPLVVDKIKKEVGDEWDLYNGQLYSNNGQKLLIFLDNLGATTHLEVYHDLKMIQQTANKHLQTLIQLGVVKVHPIANDPQIKGKFRPFNVYALSHASPDQVVKAITRFRSLLLKKKLGSDAYEDYNNLDDMSREVFEKYGNRPTENNYKSILVKHGYTTQKQWDIFLPQLVKAFKEAPDGHR